ncbi:hypothetical protein [Halalkalicoccus salilacus]|uniref:hypothetical protein n=1 Tax=Halalkalicoccus sp. GCM10025704 TaxID=3252662 RepID=UPI0036198872
MNVKRRKPERPLVVKRPPCPDVGVEHHDPVRIEPASDSGLGCRWRFHSDTIAPNGRYEVKSENGSDVHVVFFSRVRRQCFLRVERLSALAAFVVVFVVV